MNFPGKINNLTLILIISSPQQFHIVNVQCTKQNQKKSSEKSGKRFWASFYDLRIGCAHSGMV